MTSANYIQLLLCWDMPNDLKLSFKSSKALTASNFGGQRVPSRDSMK